METRNHRGLEKGNAIFPVPPSKSELAESYASFITHLKDEVSSSRFRVVMKASVEMNCLYWRLGHHINEAQDSLGWGAKVIDRISSDLRIAFPNMRGFSATNLKYMKRFASIYPDGEIGQRPVDQLPWSSIIVLMTKLDSNEERDWYAREALANGWSRTILTLRIEANEKARKGKAVTNFDYALPRADSDLAQQAFKDPYLFDFLDADSARREVELERALAEHIQDFLLELGRGFAFVGRQVPLEIDGKTFFIDMLFYHLQLRCYVVIELKACEFRPGFVSQLNMYRNAVDDLLRHEDDGDTIGLLLVKGKSELVVKYSLGGYEGPIGVADWQYQLEDSLPDTMRSSLPTIEEIEAELESEFTGSAE